MDRPPPTFGPHQLSGHGHVPPFVRPTCTTGLVRRKRVRKVIARPPSAPPSASLPVLRSSRPPAAAEPSAPAALAKPKFCPSCALSASTAGCASGVARPRCLLHIATAARRMRTSSRSSCRRHGSDSCWKACDRSRPSSQTAQSPSDRRPTVHAAHVDASHYRTVIRRDHCAVEGIWAVSRIGSGMRRDWT